MATAQDVNLLTNVTLPDGTSYHISTGQIDDWRFIFQNYYGKDQSITNQINHLREVFPMFNNLFQQWKYEVDAYNNANKDGSNPNDFYGQMGAAGLTPSETNQKGVDNSLGQVNAQTERDYQTEMRDTSLTSAGQQLQALGLSASGVLQTGGASAGVGSNVASQSMANAGRTDKEIKAQKYINTYNQQMGMTKSLIAMAGQLASSGIYGAAIGAAKHSASVMAAQTAHSGLKAIGMAKMHDGAGNGPLLTGKLAQEWSKLPGAY